jgi:hypothetical protein
MSAYLDCCRACFHGLRLVRLALIGAMLFAGAELVAQPGKPGGRNERIFEVEDLDPGEGGRLLHTLRNQRPVGDFIFRFQLEHFPEVGETRTYEGLLWGTWIDGAQVFRVHLGGGGEQPGDIAYRFLIRSGPEGFIYRLSDPQDDASAEPEPVLLAGADRFRPLLEELTYTAFDLQLPFVHWSDIRYRGTDRVIGRPAHRFLAVAPEAIETPEQLPLAGISMAVDADFYALLRADYLDRCALPPWGLICPKAPLRPRPCPNRLRCPPASSSSTCTDRRVGPQRRTASLSGSNRWARSMLNRTLSDWLTS